MSPLLPPNFNVEQLDSYQAFIPHAEFCYSPYCTACCQFSIDALTPMVIQSLGFTLPQTLKQAVKKRQAEYLASRWLVAKLLLPENKSFQLLNRADRSPIWPLGFSGSLSHHDHKAFVVLDASPALVGNDIERMLTEDKAKELQSMIMNDAEFDLLMTSGFSSAQATTLLFSLKETVYKAVYPEVQTLFGFEQVILTAINPINNIATVKLSRLARPNEYPEYWPINYCLTINEVMSWTVMKRL
ncbi:4'-phosphopantetheinyl transferase superfamily protein [Rosenbergiella australiborealis]|uniref:Enterobactin synthase component D n=1 Tax=Rosenbergiella australiborealis TaxID=1544696 RepID=A0ABS5T3Q4_9GAMM|nr:4'-phosphopantetheinyl transferase superfamily protein [Rosenbergiella australiborealis]MBT0726777.1 4'-phosphopantetheinyl transferase superfamily protein [Rosenbergiella australiborealis]